MPNKPSDVDIRKFADHQVITQPNPLRKVLRRVADGDIDDPVARAEKALADMSGEFRDWMAVESNRLSAAYAAILKGGFTAPTRDELFRAAHDIKGDAATFGFPSAGEAAESRSASIAIQFLNSPDRPASAFSARAIGSSRSVAATRCSTLRSGLGWVMT